jgi:putative membrane protein
MAKASTVKVALSILLVGSSVSVWAQDTPDRQFITKAVQGNLAETAMGRLAQQKAGSDGVRSFGQMLEQDHSSANQQATSAASSLNVTVPTQPNRLQRAAYNRMSKLSGNRFDREFVKHMVTDHRKDISDYRKQARRSDGQVSAYAQATLPTLQKHLETAQSLAKGGTPTQ